MLNVGDKVQIRRKDYYNGLTGVIVKDQSSHGFYRVDIDRDEAWSSQNRAYISSWKAWTFSAKDLVKIEKTPSFSTGDRVMVEGAEGLLDLFNGLEGEVLEPIDGTDANGPYMVHFTDASIFGVENHKLVVPVQWLKTALTEEEKTKEALIRLLDSYSEEPRWLTAARAEEIMALVGGK